MIADSSFSLSFSDLVFSIVIPESGIIVESNPRVCPRDSFPYDITLAFLKGASTIDELNQAQKDKRAANEYLDAIQKVLGKLIRE